MELLPTSHSMSDVIKEDLVLGELYEIAEYLKMSKSIQRDCVTRICKENHIPIIKGHYTRECSIQRWQGLDWEVQTLPESDKVVPTRVLKKIIEIRDKHRLYIAFPKQFLKTDPVLLYMVPCLDECSYIELARWK